MLIHQTDSTQASSKQDDKKEAHCVVFFCQKNDSSYRHDQTHGNILNLLPTNTVSKYGTVPGTINYSTLNLLGS